MGNDRRVGQKLSIMKFGPGGGSVLVSIGGSVLVSVEAQNMFNNGVIIVVLNITQLPESNQEMDHKQ